MSRQAEMYNPALHTEGALGAQIDSLESNHLVVGSIGRCALMGERKPLYRRDGTSIDIDVIDMFGELREKVIDSATFQLDGGITKTFRPLDDNEWGLFLPGAPDNEPFAKVPTELCVPVQQSLPWQPEVFVVTLPAGIQEQLIGISGQSYKNRRHIQDFKSWVAEANQGLPVAARAPFDAYRNARQALEHKHSSQAERLYTQTRSLYIGFAPSVVQRPFNRYVGPKIAQFRRAKRQTLEKNDQTV